MDYDRRRPGQVLLPVTKKWNLQWTETPTLDRFFYLPCANKPDQWWWCWWSGSWFHQSWFECHSLSAYHRTKTISDWFPEHDHDNQWTWVTSSVSRSESSRARDWMCSLQISRNDVMQTCWHGASEETFPTSSWISDLRNWGCLVEFRLKRHKQRGGEELNCSCTMTEHTDKQHDNSPVVKPKHLVCPLVVGLQYKS